MISHENQLAAPPASTLVQTITLLLVVLAAMGVVNGALFLFASSLTAGVFGLVAVCGMLILALARRHAMRGRGRLALSMLSATLLIAAFAVVWIDPATLPVAALVPPLVLLAALPYITGAELGRLVAGACLAALMLAVSAELARPLFPVPDELSSTMRIVTTALGVGLLALLIWRFSSQLQSTVARLGATVAALRSSEARYRAIVEDQTELICRFLPDGTVTLVNEANCRYWGRSQAQLVGHSFRAPIHPDDVALVDAAIAGLTPADPVCTIEHRVILASGEVRWQQWTNRAIVNARGQIVEYQSVGRDITERRRVEEQLYQREAAFKALAENLPDIVARFDLDLRHVYVNPALEQASGQRPADVIGKTNAELGMRSDLLALWDDALRTVIATGVQRAIEFSNTTPRGQRFFETLIVPEFGRDGRVESILTVSRDVTERKREQLLLQDRQKIESMGVMAGGIAHEFNNMLGVILGNADIALAELATEAPARASVEAVAGAARRAAALTRQMLSYAGTGRLVTEPVELNELISEMDALLGASVARTVELHYRLASGLPAIEGDAAQIRQVLLNLVVNAAEAIGPSGGVVSITTGVRVVDRAFLAGAFLSPDLPEGEYVTLEVVDSGAGMDADTIARVFEPFYTTKSIGRGLGLPATLGIVRGHRGAIKVSSEPGRGSRFMVLLPAVPRRPQRHTLTAVAPHAAPRHERRGRLVLVIDDEAGVRAVATRMLEWLGYVVLAARDGRQAMRLFAEHADAIDCVLLDLMLPHQESAATLQEIRRRRADVPILLMSGYTEDEARRRFAGQAFNGFLQKPFTSVELRDALGHSLAQPAGYP